MQLLETTGISKSQLSRLFGRSEQTVSKWSRGRQKPEVEIWKVFEVAAKIGCDPKDLAYAIKEAYESAQESSLYAAEDLPEYNPEN